MNDFQKIKDFIFTNSNGFSYEKTLLTTEYRLIYDTDHQRIVLTYQKWNNSDLQAINFYFTDSNCNSHDFYFNTSISYLKSVEKEFKDWCQTVLESGVLNE